MVTKLIFKKMSFVILCCDILSEHSLHSTSRSAFEKREELLRKIEAVKRLDVGVDHRAELLLIALGLKPASVVNVFEGDRKAKVVENELKALGFEVRVKPHGAQDEKVDLVVAQSARVAEKLEQLSASEDHKEYGEVMGYPRTAIEAFGDEEKALPYEEQETLTRDIPFFKIRLSREHAHDELKKVIRWNQKVFQYAPELIDEKYGEEDAARFEAALSASKIQRTRE